MRIRHFVLVGLIAVLATACGSPEEGQKSAASEGSTVEPAQAGAVLPGTGTVVETMDGGGYTYVHVDMGGAKLWAAGPQVAVKAGDKVAISTGMEMRNFESKTLGRTFPLVYFVGSITPAGQAGHTGATTMAHGRSAPVNAGEVAPVERFEGGQTVEEIVGGAGELSGQDIVVRGRVVKFNGGIMGKNWVHIQDGTGGAGTNDLTVTTDATVALGAIVVVRGKVSTDRDFGGGYTYAVIVEDATLTVE